MWWLILPGLLIAVLLFVLFAPIVIDLNSEEGFAGIRFGRLAEARLILNEALQVLRIRVGWWKKEVDLFRPVEVKREIAQRKPKQAQKKMQVGKLLRKMKGVLQSFRINRCTISIDTGDMPLNGILFPWFYLLRLWTGKNISISFTGETVVILQAQNSIARMLWAYIKS
jgi:hypothetical protein